MYVLKIILTFESATNKIFIQSVNVFHTLAIINLISLFYTIKQQCIEDINL